MANQNANMLPENLRTCDNQASWPYLMLFLKIMQTFLQFHIVYVCLIMTVML